MTIKLIHRFHSSLVQSLQQTWPAADWPCWHLYDNDQAFKYASKDALRIPPAAQELIRLMADLTMPEGDFPDLDLHAAGLHWMPQGGFLKPHRDAARHPLKKNWYRRANAILFVSECSGGALVVGHDRWQPTAATLVLINSQEVHSVEPVTGGDRMSLNLSWWSTTPPADAESNTVAQFVG